MSACHSFTEHAWKPGACKNCFKSKTLHTAVTDSERIAFSRSNRSDVTKAGSNRFAVVFESGRQPPSISSVAAEGIKMHSSGQGNIGLESLKTASVNKPTIAVRPTRMSSEGKDLGMGEEREQSHSDQRRPLFVSPVIAVQEDELHPESRGGTGGVGSRATELQAGALASEQRGAGSQSKHRQTQDLQGPCLCHSGQEQQGWRQARMYKETGFLAPVLSTHGIENTRTTELMYSNPDGLRGSHFQHVSPTHSSESSKTSQSTRCNLQVANQEKDNLKGQGIVQHIHVAEGWEDSYCESISRMPVTSSQLQLPDFQEGDLPEGEQGSGFSKKWNTVPMGRKSMERVCVLEYDDSYDEILECDPRNPALAMLYPEFGHSQGTFEASDTSSDSESSSSDFAELYPYSQPKDSLQANPSKQPPTVETEKVCEKIENSRDFEPDYATISDEENAEIQFHEGMKDNLITKKAEKQKVVLTIHLEGRSRQLSMEDDKTQTDNAVQSPRDQLLKPYRVVRSEPVTVCKPYTVVDVSSVVNEKDSENSETNQMPNSDPKSTTTLQPTTVYATPQVMPSSQTENKHGGKFYHEMWTACSHNPLVLKDNGSCEGFHSIVKDTASDVENAPIPPEDNAELQNSGSEKSTGSKVTTKIMDISSPKTCEIKFNSYNNAGMPPFPIIIHDEPYYSQSCKRKAVKVPIVINPGAYDNLSCYESFVGPGNVLKRGKAKLPKNHPYEEIKTPALSSFEIMSKGSFNNSNKNVSELKHTHDYKRPEDTVKSLLSERPHVVEDSKKSCTSQRTDLQKCMYDEPEVIQAKLPMEPKLIHNQQPDSPSAESPSHAMQVVRSKSFNFQVARPQNLSFSKMDNGKTNAHTAKGATIRERIEALSSAFTTQPSHGCSRKKSREDSSSYSPPPYSTPKAQVSSKRKVISPPQSPEKDVPTLILEPQPHVARQKPKRKISLKSLFKWRKADDDEDDKDNKSIEQQVAVTQYLEIEVNPANEHVKSSDAGADRKEDGDVLWKSQHLPHSSNKQAIKIATVDVDLLNEARSGVKVHRAEVDVKKTESGNVISAAVEKSEDGINISKHFTFTSTKEAYGEESLDPASTVSSISSKGSARTPEPKDIVCHQDTGMAQAVGHAATYSNLGSSRANVIPVKQGRQHKGAITDAIAFVAVAKEKSEVHDTPPPLPKKQRAKAVLTADPAGASISADNADLKSIFNPLYIVEEERKACSTQSFVSNGADENASKGKCMTILEGPVSETTRIKDHVPCTDQKKGIVYTVSERDTLLKVDDDPSCIYTKVRDKSKSIKGNVYSKPQNKSLLGSASAVQLAIAEDILEKTAQSLESGSKPANFLLTTKGQEQKDTGVGTTVPAMLYEGLESSEEVFARIGSLHAETLHVLCAKCEDNFMRGQKEHLRFGVESWSNFKLTSDKPCCDAGDAVYYTASYAKDHGHLYAVKICKIEGKDSQQQYYHSLAVRQSLPVHFNVQQDCGHFVADVPERLLPCDCAAASLRDGNPVCTQTADQANSQPPDLSSVDSSGQSRVVVITREVPCSNVADLIRGSVNLHRSQPELYERQVCLLLLQLCYALEHLKRHHVSHSDLRMENLLLVSGHSAGPPGHKGIESLGAELPRLIVSNFSQAKQQLRVGALAPEMLRAESRLAPELTTASQYRKCDEFQTGILVYEMLHLQNPFAERPELRERDYNPKDLPAMPTLSVYSYGLEQLAHLLLLPNPMERIHISQGRGLLQCLLWGPRYQLLNKIMLSTSDPCTLEEPSEQHSLAEGSGTGRPARQVHLVGSKAAHEQQSTGLVNREVVLQNWLELKRTLLTICFAEKYLEHEHIIRLEDWLCCQYFAFATPASVYQALRLMQAE
ncbi:inactive tyrosine-protein kinase PEAK1-like isoform X1 [Lampetra fluviatilis]